MAYKIIAGCTNCCGPCCKGCLDNLVPSEIFVELTGILPSKDVYGGSFFSLSFSGCYKDISAAYHPTYTTDCGSVLSSCHDYNNTTFSLQYYFPDCTATGEARFYSYHNFEKESTPPLMSRPSGECVWRATLPSNCHGAAYPNVNRVVLPFNRINVGGGDDFALDGCNGHQATGQGNKLLLEFALCWTPYCVEVGTHPRCGLWQLGRHQRVLIVSHTDNAGFMGNYFVFQQSDAANTGAYDIHCTGVNWCTGIYLDYGAGYSEDYLVPCSITGTVRSARIYV